MKKIESKKKASGCIVLICGFLAWIALLGIALAVISYKNHKIIYATIGEKIFYPVLIQRIDQTDNSSTLNSFSNNYFHLLEEINIYGLNEKSWSSVSNILLSFQDHKITKSELESFSNSVWKTDKTKSNNQIIQ